MSATVPLSLPTWIQPYFSKIEEVKSCKEYRDLVRKIQETQTATSLSFDQKRDRYSDITPFPANQVVLSDGTGMNASRIVLCHSQDLLRLSPEYLISSAPTVESFYSTMQMIVENDVGMIVNLTEYLEGTAIKAHRYVPGDDEQEVIFVNPSGDHSYRLRKWEEKELLQLGDEMQFEQVDMQLIGNRAEHMFRYCHFRNWKDNTPGTPIAIVKAARAVLEFERSIPHKKILIHCSAGAGRSGEFLAAMQMLKEYEANAFPYIPCIVYQLAMQRIRLAIHRKEQYEMLYTIASNIQGH